MAKNNRRKPLVRKHLGPPGPPTTLTPYIPTTYDAYFLCVAAQKLSTELA